MPPPVSRRRGSSPRTYSAAARKVAESVRSRRPRSRPGKDTAARSRWQRARRDIEAGGDPSLLRQIRRRGGRPHGPGHGAGHPQVARRRRSPPPGRGGLSRSVDFSARRRQRGRNGAGGGGRRAESRRGAGAGRSIAAVYARSLFEVARRDRTSSMRPARARAKFADALADEPGPLQVFFFSLLLDRMRSRRHQEVVP